MSDWKNITKNFKTFLYEVFSEKGIGSSKRVAGMIAEVIALLCVVYLTISEGGSNCVQSLLETTIITGACLLGVASVTGIWKK